MPVKPTKSSTKTVSKKPAAKKPSVKKPAAKKPAAKKPAAKKPAAKRSPKKSSLKKPTPGPAFRGLPDAIREALSIGANEVFYESIEELVANPKRVLKRGDFGATYQGFHRGIVTPEQVSAALEHLGPWLEVSHVRALFDHTDRKLSLGEFAGDFYDTVLLAAAIEFAEGIVRAALGTPLPKRVLPYAGALKVLGGRLGAAIDAGDATEQDFIREIYG